ncbi:MAG: hypothetical protein HN778_07420 [Prolixibacteraceae bacterium]|jgi:hypothetical protein|nr:hypothetical protein [Prolixibacteraceae bacterium]MBT6834689.1 hypothetical protein [Bacteroidota bacterium]MBT6998077.1 hypothetical protein [Prolixibacteraceae bacterium]MBT7394647.1 hypothetical protein [Prolixibacteraceae bacterium]
MQNKNNPFFISLLVALPLAIIIGLLLPLKHNKYNATIVDEENVYGFKSKIFIDWDNDGLSQSILFIENMVGQASIKPYSHYGRSLEQFNLDSKFITENPRSFVTDFDKDGYNDLFILTQKEDSLFINGFNLQKQEFFVYHRFIDLVPVVDGKNDFSARIFDAFDSNNDNIKEVFLIINAGFSLQPRNFYRLDVASNSLIKSPECFSKASPKIVFDIDKDGKNEILCLNTTSNNCGKNNIVPYPDSLNWVFVLTPDLKFKFPPKSFEGAASRIDLLPIKLDNGYGIVVLYTKRADGVLENFLMLMDVDGNEIKRVILPTTMNNRSHQLFPTGIEYESFLLLLSDGTKYHIDRRMELDHELKRDNFLNQSFIRLLDSGNNNKNYLLGNKRENNVAIASFNLKHITKLHIPVNGNHIISVKKNKNGFQYYI